MSLLESCISVLIISTVTLIAVPSVMRARESYLLDATVRQVAGKMHLARIKAVSRNRDCRIRVTSDVSYVLECQDRTWHLDERMALPTGLRITANASPEFHKRGNAAPAATITITDNQGRSKHVVINFAGRVRVD